MTLKELLGDAYKEEMSTEEIAEVLKDKDFVPKIEKNPDVENSVSPLAVAKARLRGQEIPKANPQQQSDALERLAALERENRLMKLKDSFLKGGYDPETAEKLALASADGDMETFVTVNNSFLNKRTENLKVSIKDELLHQSAGAGVCGGNEGLEEEENAGISLARELGTAAAQRDAKASEVLNYYTGGKLQ